MFIPNRTIIRYIFAFAFALTLCEWTLNILKKLIDLNGKQHNNKYTHFSAVPFNLRNVEYVELHPNLNYSHFMFLRDCNFGRTSSTEFLFLFVQFRVSH